MCEGSRSRCSVSEHSRKFSVCSDPSILDTCDQVFVHLFWGSLLVWPQSTDGGSVGMNYGLRIVLAVKCSVLLCLADARVVVVVVVVMMLVQPV
jgi:hypothetical protein